MSAKGRKCKYLTDEERIASAKEQRSNWRRKNSEFEKNIKLNSTPFQRQLVFYLRRNILDPDLQIALEDLFKDTFIIESEDESPESMLSLTSEKI
jgi:hypothetical protein